MLHTEWKWSQRKRHQPRIKVGVHAVYIRGSQSDHSHWKLKNFPEDHKPHQWFIITAFDRLSNWAENSPKSNARLRAAQNKHCFMRRKLSDRLNERLGK